MANKSNGRVDVTLYGISDTELLAIIDDIADADGWASNYDIRLTLGESADVKRSGVPSRVAWMRRYGWLERDSANPSAHRLTTAGRAMLTRPDLSKTMTNALAAMTPAQRLTLTREIARNGGDIRTALRRQWIRSLR